MSAFPSTAMGVSPVFTVSAEEFLLNYRTAVSKIAIDGVHPPILGPDGGYTRAMELRNRWSPWIDEKLVEPKFDGVCKHLGMVSNRPTYVKDYHAISVMRAVDYILKPSYVAHIQVTATSITPIAPVTA